MTGKSALSIESLSRGPVTYVRLYGTIDETFNPSALVDTVGAGDVILNLKAVSRISSFGVRDWVHTIEVMRKKVNRIIYVDCSPAVVAQLNMVANFGAGATVASVQAPFFCEKCGWDTEVSIPLAEGATGTELPHITCKRCRAEMALDDDPETYFAFRRGLRGAALDPSIKAFIAEFSRAIDNTVPDAAVSPASSDAPRVDDKPAGLKQALHRGFAALSAWVSGVLAVAVRFVRAHPRTGIGVGIGLGILVIGAVVLMLVRAPGVPPKQMALFHESVANGHYAKAEELILQLQRDRRLTKDLKVLFVKQIADARLKATKERQDAVAQAFRAKRFSDVVAAAGRPIENVPLDLDSSFLLAEALRQLDRCREALPLYATLEKDILKLNAADKRLDDAVFWQGECALKLNLNDAARGHFRRVAFELPRGDFRTSALARLKSLDKK